MFLLLLSHLFIHNKLSAKTNTISENWQTEVVIGLSSAFCLFVMFVLSMVVNRLIFSFVFVFVFFNILLIRVKLCFVKSVMHMRRVNEVS